MRWSVFLCILLTMVIIIAAAPVSADNQIYHMLSAPSSGKIQYNPADTSFDTLHSAASGTKTNSLQAVVKSSSTSNLWDYFDRGYLLFHTYQGDKTEATTAFFQFTVSARGDQLSDTLKIAFVRFFPASNSSIAGADYDNFELSDTLAVYTLSNITNGMWYGFWIDPADLTGWLNDDYTAIGFLLYSDWSNTEPTWASEKTDYVTIGDAYLIIEYTEPTPTPTPDPSNATLSINILEKYSNAALVGQSVSLTPTTVGTVETKTSTYGETLHFSVVNGYSYWINASRSGYADYNETYTITSSSGIYNVYMERILTPIANHSYAHFSVVDQTNGGLIPNAEIRLSDGQTKLTNSAGYAWFSVNNSEQINYYVSKPSGYWPAYGAMNLTADESILVALQRYTGPTATATMPGWTPVTVPTTGTGVDPVVTLSAQLRQQNVQEGMDVWYTNLPFISQFLFLLFIIGGLGLMAGGTRRN